MMFSEYFSECHPEPGSREQIRVKTGANLQSFDLLLSNITILVAFMVKVLCKYPPNTRVSE